MNQSEIAERAAREIRRHFDEDFDTTIPGEVFDRELVQIVERAIAESQAPQAEGEAYRYELLCWVIEKWNLEVAYRPMRNVYRRILDDTWRQVMRKLGGDPELLVGPRHEDLAAAPKGNENV